MEPILKVEHVSKAFGKGEAYLKVLDDVSLEIHKGEFASLMGPSGSGKSTLLYIIGGLDIEYEGNIYISGPKMTGMKDEEQSALRLSKIGFIFQFYNLVQNLSVEDNILLPIKMAGKAVENHKEKLEDILDRFSFFGLPLHFTENTLISGELMPPEIVDLNDYQPDEWPSTPEGEERQANEIEEMYRILFAHPLVEAITTWDYRDGAWLAP